MPLMVWNPRKIAWIASALPASWSSVSNWSSMEVKCSFDSTIKSFNSSGSLARGLTEALTEGFASSAIVFDSGSSGIGAVPLGGDRPQIHHLLGCQNHVDVQQDLNLAFYLGHPQQIRSL